MNERKFLSILLLTSFTFFCLVQLTSSCNQMLCASQVSKCMLTQQCKCDIKNGCSCCKDCLQCLSWLWNECCSCVDLCPKPNDTKSNPLSKQSHHETLEEDIPALFSALVEDPEDDKWAVFTFPVDYDATTGMHANQQLLMQSSDRQNLPSVQDANTVTVNCSVAYMSDCMSMKKCKDTCNSMGASSFRWFFDHCCECVGKTCQHFGIDESRCSECPETKINDGGNNSLDNSAPPEDLDFGEDMRSI